MDCPICGSRSTRRLATARRSFFRCGDCGFSWAAPDSRPDPAAAAERYALHRNDSGDPRYVAYLSRVIDRALEAAGPSARKVVDWGSGPNPVCASLLRKRGLEVALWDPAFAADGPPPVGAFDLGLCIEVAEHFADPVADFLSFASRLKSGAYAAVRTGIAPADDDEFLRWWYIEDPTHVSFYSEEALRFLGRAASLAVEGIEGGNLAIFRRPLPVLVAGGANIDIEGRPRAALVAADSNPGSVRSSPGGTARNVAEDLARLGVAVELVAAIGSDAAGTQLAERTAAAGVGTAGVERYEGEASSCYLSILDADGDMAVAVNAMDLYDRFGGDRAVEAAGRAVAAASASAFVAPEAVPFSALVLDGNLLPATAEALLDRFPDVPVWFDPVSTAKARRFAQYRGGALLGRLAAAKPNAMETGALLGAAPDPAGEADSPGRVSAAAIAVRDAGVDTVYVSRGAEGVLFVSEGGAFAAASPRVDAVSATGAGDAFLAGALRSFLLGGDGGDRCAAGCAAAAAALASAEACPPELSGANLERTVSAWRRAGAFAWKEVIA